MFWQSLEQSIADATGRSFSIDHKTGLSGGSINSAYRISGGEHNYFVKLNQADKLHMFEAKADGLRELDEVKAIRIPAPICFGEAARKSWLVTEYIELGRGAGDSAQHLGQQLAALHRHTSERFGWFRDNTIGSTPQQNNWSDCETDIAMTELFGGFGSDFYDAYNEAWPLDEGYKVRKQLYNLKFH